MPGSAKPQRDAGHFPTEQAALKVLYLVSIERKKNRTNPTGPEDFLLTTSGRGLGEASRHLNLLMIRVQFLRSIRHR